MRKILLMTLAILAALLPGIGLSYQQGYSGKIESITIGRPVSDSGVLIFTAAQQGFFEANGLKVNQKDYDTGLAAVNALLNNEIDLAGMGELPFVGKALENARVSTVGCFARSFNTYLVARVDKGIRNVGDLRGKRIGLPLRTIPEFYLSRFLDLQGIRNGEVALINLTPSQSVAAIADGTVDAVVVWEPYVSQIKERLPNAFVSWSVHGGQAQYSVLAGRMDWIKQNPELVERFVKSLLQAEEYVLRHPTKAKAILQTRYNYDGAYVAMVWPQYEFSLFLDQSFVLAMEDEARWMISNNLTTEKTVPNFLDYIYTDGLKSVKPSTVRIAGK